jgi:hypothetical protein
MRVGVAVGELAGAEAGVAPGACGSSALFGVGVRVGAPAVVPLPADGGAPIPEGPVSPPRPGASPLSPGCSPSRPGGSPPRPSGTTTVGVGVRVGEPPRVGGPDGSAEA